MSGPTVCKESALKPCPEFVRFAQSVIERELKQSRRAGADTLFFHQLVI
jgi:hypothetical protein